LSASRELHGLITTSPSGDEEEARELAARFGLLAEPRRGRRVDELLARAFPGPVLVLGALSAELFAQPTAAARETAGQGEPAGVRASLGMAMLRFTRALAGEPDSLLRAAALRPGELVIDATLGLGGDALMAAQATGARVIGLEKSPMLAAFAQAALRRPPGDANARKAALEAAARIDIRAVDHRDALAQMPDQSADVVLFDPMFRATLDAAPVFDVVREHAEMASLSPETLAQARRVARRGVLIKDSPRGSELRRLGVPEVYARRFLFGWLPSH